MCLAVVAWACLAQTIGSVVLSAHAQREDNAKETETTIDVNELIQTVQVFTNSLEARYEKISLDLWAGTYEVTQKEYQEIMGNNPSKSLGEDLPVDNVSWLQAMAFCEKLTAHEREKEMLPDGYVYTLPTQDQWESFARGVDLSAAVTSSGGTRSGPAQVGSLAPSPQGLFDVRGNVAELCKDPSDGAFRVARGGSWRDWIEVNLRVEFRIFMAPSETSDRCGFRCVLQRGAP
jgi:formylglycine-generating enzyme required for sulfatase activity